jgi:hypothetical protein
MNVDAEPNHVYPHNFRPKDSSPTENAWSAQIRFTYFSIRITVDFPEQRE